MKFLSTLEGTIDRGIGIFAPAREVNRRIARRQAEQVRQYAAAKTTRLTGDWVPVNQDVNSLIRSSSAVVRARSRQLVRDFPFFAKAVNTLANYTVGTGIKFQSQVRDADGKFDKTTIQKIEDAIDYAMEEMDVSGRLHGYELESLAKRQDVESGEFLFVKVALKDRNRYIPYALQAYEADWLTSASAHVVAGNEIDQGIEFDPMTGRPVAYHFAVPAGYSYLGMSGSTKTQRIPAEDVIHNFKTLRPGQLRGISPFTTAILVAHDLGDYLDATIDVAKLASKYLAFVKTSDIGGFQKGRTSDDNGKKIESIENAVIEYLRPGEDVQFATHNMPGGSFEPFCKFVLRMVAVSTDTTYELLTADYDSISYSNLRGIRNDFAVMIKPHSQRHILHCSQPIRRDIITWAVRAGRLELPGYFLNPRRYWQGTYTPPGMESIDPLREGKAWIEQIQSGLRSPQEVTAGRGRDYEEVLDEIAEAKKMMEERGLTFGDISTAMQQNPAKLGAKEE